MKKIAKLLIVIPALVFPGCNGKEQKSLAIEDSFEAISVSPDIPVTYEEAADMKLVSNTAAEDRKVIKTADVSMQVEKLDSAKFYIDRIIGKYNAYVSNDSRNNDHYRLILNMTIRVQQNQMDQLLKEILSQASFVHYNNVSARDVTEEFMDLDIRLRNKKAVEEQYIKLLQKATKVEDILKIENELRVIREEIEVAEGRLKYLSNQVQMATIHLNAYQDIYEADRAPAKSFWLKVRDGFTGGWELLKNIVIALMSIWPIVVALGLATYAIVNKIRRYRLKRSS